MATIRTQILDAVERWECALVALKNAQGEVDKMAQSLDEVLAATGWEGHHPGDEMRFYQRDELSVGWERGTLSPAIADVLSQPRYTHAIDVEIGRIDAIVRDLERAMRLTPYSTGNAKHDMRAAIKEMARRRDDLTRLRDDHKASEEGGE